MHLRPCIDLHDGQVKQIVGSSIRDEQGRSARYGLGGVKENFVSFEGAAHYAAIYREKNLPGGHIILLNSKERQPELYEVDRQQALAALRAYPGGMQAGGGMTPENASDFLDAGASHVIVTSYVFRNGELDLGRLARMQEAVGREHFVLDLSCRRRKDGSYAVVTDRWQKETSLTVDSRTLGALSAECGEFLIHAADVEGRRAGIELPLVRILGQWLAQRQKEGKTDFAVTYAGGIHSLEDVRLLRQASGGSLDFTVGSALDLFGGNLHLDALMEEASRKF